MTSIAPMAKKMGRWRCSSHRLKKFLMLGFLYRCFFGKVSICQSQPEFVDLSSRGASQRRTRFTIKHGAPIRLEAEVAMRNAPNLRLIPLAPQFLSRFRQHIMFGFDEQNALPRNSGTAAEGGSTPSNPVFRAPRVAPAMPVECCAAGFGRWRYFAFVCPAPP